MNIALSAVVIFILLLPPVAFYSSYLLGRFSKAGPKFSLLDGVLFSAIFALLTHAIAILLIPYEIRFDVLLKIIGGDLKSLQETISNQELEKYLRQFTLYNLIIIATAVLLGRGARWLVKTQFNHGQNELLRIHNRWWYLFNGFENDIKDFDLVFVDAVVNTQDGTMIYSGFLIDYICDGEQLDRIYLGDTVRREFKRNNTDNSLINDPGIPVTIPGEVFSLTYENSINLNLRFIILGSDIEVIQQLPEVGDDDSLIPPSGMEGVYN